MEKLNEKYSITKEMFIKLINKLCNKRHINIQILENDNNFKIITKLNKILLQLKIFKMKIG